MSSAQLVIDAATGEPPENGPGVFGHAGKLHTGKGVRIGVPADSSFRRVAGVQIEVDELILDDGVIIEREVSLRGRRIHLGKGVRIKAGSSIQALENAYIGAGGSVGEDCEITVRRINIGRQLWMLPFAKIGGGSATDIDSELTAGPWLHLGMHTLLNTAKPISLGREVGLGTRTSLYTHGAYPSMLNGFPVSFAPITVGDYSWLPGATVNPGVNIGKYCVVGVNSLVVRDIPDGSLAGGSPAKIIRENAFPTRPNDEELERKMRAFLREYAHLLTDKHQTSVSENARGFRLDIDQGRCIIAWALSNESAAAGDEIRLGRVASGGKLNINLDGNTLDGAADADAARLLNQLRRHGVRFDFEPEGGRFRPWQETAQIR